MRWLVLCGALVGLGFEAKMAVALMVVPGIAAAWLWVAPRGRLAAVASCWPAAPRWSPSAARGRCRVARRPRPTRPWISGTSDNSDLVADPRLQRPRPADRPGRRPRPGRRLRRRRAGRRRWRRPVRRRHRPAAPAQRGDGRPGRLVARLRDRRRARGRAREPAAPHRRAHRLADRRRRRVPHHRRRVQLAEGIFHPYYVSLLAPFTAALVGARRRRAAAGGATARRAGAARDRRRRGRRADGPARQPGRARLAAGRAARGRRWPRRSRSCSPRRAWRAASSAPRSARC